MIVETIKLKEMGVFPELFLGIAIIYLVMHGLFVSVNNTYKFPLIQISMVYLGVLTLSMVCFLYFNDGLSNLDYISFSNNIANDFLSSATKIIICMSSIICLLMIQQYLVDQKLNHSEYVLVILFAVLGIFLLCSANDLITAYLAIELQSLSFYILAAFQKNSTYSVEGGLKYFILGAFSSGLFLFGSSLIYGIIGSVNFEDFKDLFFWIFPGSVFATKELNELDVFSTENSEQDLKLKTLAGRLALMENNSFLTYTDVLTIYREFDNIEDNFFLKSKTYNFDKLDLYFDIANSLERISHENVNIEFKLDIFIKQEITFDNVYYEHIGFKLIEQFYESNNIMFYYPQTFLKIAQLMPNFVKPMDLQLNTYFYEPFDLNLLQFALIFILISLFFKLALAPFHLWSPDIYEGSPSSSTFFFVVVPKLGIFVLLLRICYFGFYGFIDHWRSYVIIIAILSVVVGSVAGLEQRKLKSLLAYSSISHMGYLLIPFSTGSLEGIQMLFSYIIIYMLSGLCIWSIFVLTRLKNNFTKKQNKDLADLALLSKSNNTLALIFTVALFSIAGIPPMIGFIVKIGVFLAAIESSMFFIALLSILFSVISTFYYIRIIKILYFEQVLVGKLYYPITTQKSFVIALLFYFFIFLFINPTVMYLFSYKISLMF